MAANEDAVSLVVLLVARSSIVSSFPPLISKQRFLSSVGGSEMVDAYNLV